MPSRCAKNGRSHLGGWSRPAAGGVKVEGDEYEVRVHVATFAQSEDDVLRMLSMSGVALD